MRQYLSESELLKKLNITDFAQIDCGKFREFVRLFRDIDPEIADKVISTIPEFSKLTMATLDAYKFSYERGVEAIEKSNANYHCFCSEIVSVLKILSEKPDLSTEEKRMIINSLMELESRIAVRDEEDRAAIIAERKEYNNHIDLLLGLTVGAALFFGGLILGSSGPGRKL